MARSASSRGWLPAMRRMLLRSGIVFLALFMLPLAVSYGARTAEGFLHWSEARRDSSAQAPDPAVVTDAVIQVYAGRAWGWRGIFGVHTWIATKRRDATSYRRHEVIGWGVRHGRQAVRSGQGIADGYWFGSRPELLAELRGAAAEQVIERIEQAVLLYPYPDRYRAWPGPNSNTFTAFVARKVPELRLDLPPTAIGKDYLSGWAPVAKSPSGTGVQFSLEGLFGVLVALEEGVEVNVFGLTFGLDVYPPALKLPGLGRVGL